MRQASELNLFHPPEYGDVIRFANGSRAVVSQDSGDGWHLIDAGRRICQSGFDMQAFIRTVLAEDRRREMAA